MTYCFSRVIDQLVDEIEGLRNSIDTLMNSASVNSELNHIQLGQFLEEKGEFVSAEGENVKNYRIVPAQFSEFRRISRRWKSSQIAQSLLPGSLLVTLVSRFDAFLGRLIRTMFLARPELLKSSERSLSLSNLLELGNYDSAKEFLIEKEIESVLRTRAPVKTS